MRSCSVRIAGIVALASCGGGNIEGKLAADRVGDVSNPADRGDPRAPLAAACPDASGAPPVATPFARAPYLQKTTGSATEIVWVSASGAAPSAVVTAPDGTPVASV